MAFAALTAMTVRNRFGAGTEMVFDGTAKATALEGLSHFLMMIR
jgi:hypothetical protein